jgi:hypothetical protein
MKKYILSLNLHCMKKLLPFVILLSMGITQIYAQSCFDCDYDTNFGI